MQRNWEYVRPYFRWGYYRIFPARRPDYFHAPWRYPYLRLGRDRLSDFRHGATGARAFLFFPLVDWHARMQRSQHLATALAEAGHFCIYVNPHLGLEYHVPSLFSGEARVCALAPRIFELHVHLPAEHPIESRLLSRNEAAKVVKAVSHAVSEFGISDAVQIISVPSWLEAVTAIRSQSGFPIVYDCHDFLPGFERMSHEVIASERALLSAADRVVFSAQHLMETVARDTQGVEQKAILVRNASRPTDFEAGGLSSGRLGSVAYAGSLDHWFDIDFVATAAERNPNLTFKLAGRLEDRRVRRLETYTNVRFYGEIPYSALPNFLHSCDAAMIPFRRTDLTLCTSPIKMYEYLSAGLPVVSSRLPEVELHQDLVYIADSPQEFASLIRQAVKESDPSERQRRVARGRSETWAERAGTLSRVLGNKNPRSKSFHRVAHSG